jgi:hypothetical protein
MTEKAAAVQTRAQSSLDDTVGAYAQQEIAQMKPEQLVEELKRQGINSLDDLAKSAIAAVRAAGNGGAGALYEDAIDLICYKFTTYRPHPFTRDELRDFTQFAQQRVG